MKEKDKRSYQHEELAAGRWKTMPFCEQMANVGSVMERIFFTLYLCHP